MWVWERLTQQHSTGRMEWIQYQLNIQAIGHDSDWRSFYIYSPVWNMPPTSLGRTIDSLKSKERTPSLWLLHFSCSYELSFPFHSIRTKGRGVSACKRMEWSPFPVQGLALRGSDWKASLAWTEPFSQWKPLPSPLIRTALPSELKRSHELPGI